MKNQMNPRRLVKQLIVKFLFAFILFSIYPNSSYSQDVEESIKLNGPRVGFTQISAGKTADKLKSGMGVNPFITQFGWQFETQFFTLSSGTCGLIEVVPLIGGLEQGVILPSGNVLIGLRNHKGLEFGFGPNISLAGPALVLAAGVTFHSEDVNFPVNLALVPSKDGLRLSLLVGFNARKNRVLFQFINWVVWTMVRCFIN